jgi:hypothetical protein
MNCSYTGLLHQEQRVVCFAKDVFFFDMFTQEGEERIRTNDFRFMRHSPEPIELHLGDMFC